MKEQYENSIFVLSDGTGFRATATRVCEGVVGIDDSPDSFSGSEIVQEIYVLGEWDVPEISEDNSRKGNFSTEHFAATEEICPN